jgi:hypothetical protein
MQTERQNANDRLLVTAKHAMRLIVIASFILASSAAGARAADPDVATLVAEMKSALEPARPSVRKLTMRVSNELGESEPLPISLPSIGSARCCSVASRCPSPSRSRSIIRCSASC